MLVDDVRRTGRKTALEVEVDRGYKVPLALLQFRRLLLLVAL
jgi:hypothetical protein